MLAIKVALSRYEKFEQRTGIELYPIIGSASLPFRGGLTPHTVGQFAHEYRGIHTALIQSAFRYDYDKKDVVQAIAQLDDLLRAAPVHVTARDEQHMRDVMPYFESAYRSTIEPLAQVINIIASALPKRRERVQHTGLFGYSRGVGSVRLPRAIGFTGALYSLGIPPEIIGTGRGLHAAKEAGLMDAVETYYINVRSDLLRSGRYINKEVIAALARLVPACENILTDIHYIEEYLGEPLGPVTLEEKEHALVTEKVYRELQQGMVQADTLTRAAQLRKSLG